MCTNIRRLTEEEKGRLNEGLSKLALKIDGGSIENDTLYIGTSSTGWCNATFNRKKVIEIIKTVFPNYRKIILNGTLTTA